MIKYISLPKFINSHCLRINFSTLADFNKINFWIIFASNGSMIHQDILTAQSFNDIFQKTYNLGINERCPMIYINNTNALKPIYLVLYPASELNSNDDDSIWQQQLYELVLNSGSKSIGALYPKDKESHKGINDYLARILNRMYCNDLYIKKITFINCDQSNQKNQNILFKSAEIIKNSLNDLFNVQIE